MIDPSLDSLDAATSIWVHLVFQHVNVMLVHHTFTRTIHNATIAIVGAKNGRSLLVSICCELRGPFYNIDVL